MDVQGPRDPSNNRVLHLQGLALKLMLACRTCRAPPRHSHVFKAHGVGTYHWPINTIRSILVHPKDKTPDAQKCGLVYQVECPECPLTYIGETGRTLATSMKDHLNLRNPLTAVGEHCAHEHHKTTKGSVKVLAREDI